MKFNLFILLFFSAALGFSQSDDMTVTTASFSEVKVYDGLSVTIKKGPINELKITGEDPKNVVILNEKGVFTIPDILANSGGVIVSYFEWVQGQQSFFWSEKDVNNKLWEIISNAFGRVYDFHQAKKIDMRLSAFAVSIEHLSKAMLYRGFFP